VTEQDRETAGAVRSTNVAHFLAPDWTQTAQRAAGALERIDRERPAVQVLVVVPDDEAAHAVARELRLLTAAHGVSVVPVTSSSRAGRMLKSGPAQVLVGRAHALADLLPDSTLKLADVASVILVAADELEPESGALATLMAEVPKKGARMLLAAEATPFVESLLERYLHRARRMADSTPEPLPLPEGTPPTISVIATQAGKPLAPLAALLDDIDPPSLAIVVGDARDEGRARAALEALGYPVDSPLVTVTRGDVALHTALVVFAGLPDAAQLRAAFGAHPARMVALVTTRQRKTLAERGVGAKIVPYDRSRSARAARAREDATRAALQQVLDRGLSVREVLALEPMLEEHDGLAIAAAALRLYEEAREATAAAHAAGREELRLEIKARADAAAAAERADRPKDSGPPRKSFGDRGGRGGPRPSFGSGRPARPSFGDDRAPRGERPERSDRGERPERPARSSFSDRPPRGDRPSAPRGDRPGGSDRGPRSDDSRGPRKFNPRGPRKAP
jgi:ATP-dependent RNA helicase DeaD